MANKMANKKSPKNKDQRFVCESCDYFTSRLSEFKRHIITTKHRKLTKNHQSRKGEFNCICGKEYIHASSLSKHKRKCKMLIKENEILNDSIEEPIENNIINDSTEETTTKSKKDPMITDYVEIINKLLADNKELRNLVLDQSEEHKKETSNILSKVMEMKSTQVNNTIHGNVNNNRFSINMFLNEQCKDAINFTEFIDKIEVSHEDLENNAQLGFVDGISKILVDNLKQLSVYERPIHCTDIKREIMYIKDDNEWQKEKAVVKEKLSQAIKSISRKSISSLLDWKQNNPEYENIDSEFSNKCIVIQQHSTAGNKQDIYYPKVIHNLAKENTI